MSKKVGPTPSVAFTPGGDGPATARPSSSSTQFNSRRALETFLEATASETACAQIVEEIVTKASTKHLSNHYDGLAVEYTAHAMWAEMLAVVGQSFVSLDAGMPRNVRPAKLKHVDASAAWKADDPPIRVATEEHSRRIMGIRRHYEPPPPVTDDDAASVGSLGKTQRTTGATKPRAVHRKNTQTFDASVTGGSRPTSGSSRRSSSDDPQHTGNNHQTPPGGSRAANAARKVLQNVNVIKGFGATKNGLDGTHSLGATATTDSRQGSQRNLKTTTTLKRTNTNGQIAKGGPDATPNTLKNLTSPRVPETLLQQEPSQAAEELEVLQHQQHIQRLHEAVEESSRKAAKITKQLADPKIAGKPFVVDGSGAVIPVLNMEHLQDGRQIPTVESPRFQLTANAPPPSVAPAAQPARRGGPPRGAVEPTKAAAVTDAKKGASPKLKDEQFFTSDTTEIPMNINVQPVGGVGVKDGSGPLTKADLKVPASKMLRSEYVKLVTAFETNMNATSNFDEQLSEASTKLSKTAPVAPTQESTSKGSRRGTDGTAEDRLGGTQGSQTARVPTVPHLKRSGQPSSARKPPSSHGGVNRANSTSPTAESAAEAALHTQPPALPPQRPKVTEPRQRPHFHAKPTHDATSTNTALKTSTDWKETSVKRSSIGVTRVLVKHDLDAEDDPDAL